MNRLVTVYTDASFHPATCAAGWAVWYKHGEESETISGGFMTDTSTQAEFVAACQGLSIADAALGDNPGVIMLNVDCMSVINAVNLIQSTGHSGIVTVTTQWLIEYFANAPAGRQVLTRHVSAHKRNNHRRTRMNRLVDQRSRAAMKKQRSKLTSVPHASIMNT